MAHYANAFVYRVLSPHSRYEKVNLLGVLPNFLKFRKLTKNIVSTTELPVSKSLRLVIKSKLALESLIIKFSHEGSFHG